MHKFSTLTMKKSTIQKYRPHFTFIFKKNMSVQENTKHENISHMHCAGVCLSRGKSAQGGVCPGGCLPRGCLLRRGVSQHAIGQTPPIDRQTPVKT